MRVCPSLSQADIGGLKALHGKALHLRRAPRSSPTTPFPIGLALSIEPPAGVVEHYDIGPLNLEVVLGPRVLQCSSPTLDGDATQESGLRCRISNPELPRELRMAIAARLEAEWCKRRAAVSAASLHLPCMRVGACMPLETCLYLARYYAMDIHIVHIEGSLPRCLI